jgi:hypothetical protein
MRAFLLFAFIFAAATAFAQQPPEAVPHAVPPPSRPTVPQLGNKQLTELLRAQTSAIRTLSRKIEDLEERVQKIEKRQP